MSEDVQGYDDRVFRYLKRFEEDLKRKDDRGKIFGFYKDLQAKSLSKGRLFKYLWTMRGIIKIFGKPLTELTTDDLKETVRVIDNNPWTAWTKHDYKQILRAFCRYLNKEHGTNLDVSWIKLTVKLARKLPEELLTEEEVRRLVDACDNPRDRALISVLYESGCRIGEILGLKLKHVTFDQYGAVLMVDGKTGQRRVRIISSSLPLAAYLETHPMKGEAQAPLWVTKFNNCIGYVTINELLKELKRKTGINKRIHPHLFRHSRATHLAPKMSESIMKAHFGWVGGSDMPATYIHLSGQAVDDSLLKIYGLQPTNGQEPQAIRPVFCPRCKTQNSTLQRFCSKCASPLDEKELLAIDIKDKEETQTRTEFETLMMDFMTVLAQRDPTIKQVFNEVVQKRKAAPLLAKA